jgi:enolase-phosphatase E1
LLWTGVYLRATDGELELLAQPGGDSIQALLLDIEGTTTPIDFVFRTLFPYARQRLQQFLLQHGSEPGVREDIAALQVQQRADIDQQMSPPRWINDSPGEELASAAAYGAWLMDRDAKCTALKSLQGKIWQEGYRAGKLRGEVYPDVPPAMFRWSRQEKIICIFSSGSVLAQKLLFGSTTDGDLTGFIRFYFDTTTGPKNAPGSYLRIAAMLGLESRNILFISDIVKELDAARDAGMQTALCVRTEPREHAASAHRVIHSFEGIFPGS